MYFSLIVTFLLLMLLVVASVQNTTAIQIKYLAWELEMSLTGLIFYASLLGGPSWRCSPCPRWCGRP